MQERRRDSKWLPEIFLFLQMIATFLFSYISYGILLNFSMPHILLILFLGVVNVFYFLKFHTRYLEVKNRTKYLRYE